LTFEDGVLQAVNEINSYELVMANTRERPFMTVEKLRKLEELTKSKIPKSS